MMIVRVGIVLWSLLLLLATRACQHRCACLIGGALVQVQERYGKLDEALALFNQAVDLSAENALVRYHRAKVLIAKRQYKVRTVLIGPFHFLFRSLSPVLCCSISCLRSPGRNGSADRRVRIRAYLSPLSDRLRSRTWRRSETRHRTSRMLSSSSRRCTGC